MLRVLIPTDFSDNAKAACKATIGQFDLKQTKFTLYHSVVEPRKYSGMLVNITDIMQKDAVDQLIAEINQLHEFFGLELKIKPITKIGYLEDMINTVIRSESIDLISMSTKGESNILTKVIGSNAAHVIRKSIVPVLAIPSGQTMFNPVNIAIATDNHTLPYWKEIERITKAFKQEPNLSVVTVLTDDAQRAPKSIELNRRFIPVNTERNDDVMEGISSYLSKNDVDLLAIYHSHKTRLDYLFSRSVTKKLTAEVSVPILVLPG